MLPNEVLLTFALVLGIIGAIYYVAILRPEQEEQGALRRRLKTGVSTAKAAGAGLRRQESPLSSIPAVNRVLGSTSAVSGPLRRLLDRSGLEITVGTLVLLCLCGGVAGYLLVMILTHLTLAAAMVGVVFAYLPIWVVGFMAKRRVMKFEEQFPEAIELLSRALRAGHAFTTGLVMAADEIPAPVGEEFKLLYDRQNFGMPLPEAMTAFAARI